MAHTLVPAVACHCRFYSLLQFFGDTAICEVVASPQEVQWPTMTRSNEYLAIQT